MRTTAFGQISRSWLDALIFRVRARRVLKALPEVANEVLDLGSGWDAKLLRHAISVGRVRRGTAVDIALDDRIATASLRLLTHDLARQLPLRDSTQDVVLSLAVLEHLEEPEHHVAEMFRLLRKGGRAIITTPSPRSRVLLETLAYRLHVIDEAEIRDHRQYFGESDLRILLENAGFSRFRYRAFALGMNQLVIAER
jgi:ubiquinone/menaquinone biosynthesis C-methylase UbiE